MFPKSYQNVAFIARRGSWNREQKFGYDVVVARTSGGKAKIEPFLTGLLDEKGNSFSGRPTYVHFLKDGSMLVSDEQNGAVGGGAVGAENAAVPQRVQRIGPVGHLDSVAHGFPLDQCVPRDFTRFLPCLGFAV